MVTLRGLLNTCILVHFNSCSLLGLRACVVQLCVGPLVLVGGCLVTLTMLSKHLSIHFPEIVVESPEDTKKRKVTYEMKRHF